MRNLAVIGLVGAAVFAGFSGVASAAEEIVTPRLVIESVPDEAFYAVASVRSIDLSNMADKALAEPELGTEITGTVGSAGPAVDRLPEQEVAAAATVVVPVVPTARPDFESSQSVTSEPIKRKVVKVNARIVAKKRVSLPVPVVIGAFR